MPPLFVCAPRFPLTYIHFIFGAGLLPNNPLLNCARIADYSPGEAHTLFPNHSDLLAFAKLGLGFGGAVGVSA
jgi:hypothetical protein